MAPICASNGPTTTTTNKAQTVRREWEAEGDLGPVHGLLPLGAPWAARASHLHSLLWAALSWLHLGKPYSALECTQLLRAQWRVAFCFGPYDAATCHLLTETGSTTVGAIESDQRQVD